MVQRLQTTYCFSVGLHFEVGKVGSIWSGMVRRVYIWLTIGFCCDFFMIDETRMTVGTRSGRASDGRSIAVEGVTTLEFPNSQLDLRSPCGYLGSPPGPGARKVEPASKEKVKDHRTPPVWLMKSYLWFGAFPPSHRRPVATRHAGSHCCLHGLRPVRRRKGLPPQRPWRQHVLGGRVQGGIF